LLQGWASPDKLVGVNHTVKAKVELGGHFRGEGFRKRKKKNFDAFRKGHSLEYEPQKVERG